MTATVSGLRLTVDPDGEFPRLALSLGAEPRLMLADDLEAVFADLDAFDEWAERLDRERAALEPEMEGEEP